MACSLSHQVCATKIVWLWDKNGITRPISSSETRAFLFWLHIIYHLNIAGMDALGSTQADMCDATKRYSIFY